MNFKASVVRKGTRASKIRAMQDAAKIAGKLRTENCSKTASAGQSHGESSEVKYQALLNGGEDK